MKLPSFKRLFYTDFEADFQALVEQLSNTINQGFETLYNALNNNLTLSDNLAASVKDVTLSVDSTGRPTSPTAFTISNSNTISGLQVLKATNNTNATVYPTGGIFITYTQSSNQITINNITGLPVNNQFSIRVVAFLT